jgi:hypothetical protein
MVVVQAELVADTHVGLVERGDLELIRARIGRALPEGRRVDQRSLQLRHELVEGGGEAGPAGRGGEDPEICPRGGLAGESEPLGPADRRPDRCVGRAGDEREELIEGAHRRADHDFAVSSELLLEALDVVHGRDHEHRVSRGNRAKCVENGSRPSRVRRPDDQLQPHPKPA